MTNVESSGVAWSAVCAAGLATAVTAVTDRLEWRDLRDERSRVGSAAAQGRTLVTTRRRHGRPTERESPSRPSETCTALATTRVRTKRSTSRTRTVTTSSASRGTRAGTGSPTGSARVARGVTPDRSRSYAFVGAWISSAAAFCPWRNSRLRSTSALISAPRSRAQPVSQSQVSITITAASEPHALLYEENMAV
jgi:hypothetical protein